jgi:hypothetical protein
MMKLIFSFHNSLNLRNDENFGQCTCLCAICNKAYFVKEFVSTPTQALLGFWIQLVQVKGMLHDFGGGVKVGCGPI